MRAKVQMMQDIVPTTENRQTDDWDIRKEHQGMYLGRCICAGGSWATIWSNTAYGDGGRAGMSEISMGIIEEEEDTAYHVFFDHSGPPQLHGLPPIIDRFNVDIFL